MASLPVSTPQVNLYADEWGSREVADFALYALRSTGGVASLVAGLYAHSEAPIVNGERKVNTRHWFIRDSESGEIVAKGKSLYKAIHSIAR